YVYQVRARGAGGSLSPYSGEISVTTLAIQPASGLTVSEVTDQSAIVTWTPSPHGAYLSGYVIYRTKLAAAPSGRTMTEVGRVSNAVTDYHDFGMRADTEYTYSVKAYIGTEFSAECAAEPITTLAAPAVNLGYTETVATAYADSNAGPITPYSGTTHAQDFTRNHTGLNAVRLDFGILSGTNLGAQFSCGGNYNISQSVADGTAALTFWQLAVGGSAESVEIVDADSRRVSIPLRGYSQGDYGKWKYMVVPLSGSGPDWTKIRNIVFKKWGNAVPFSMWIDDLKIVKFGAPSAAGLSLCSADGENTGAATAEGGYTASSATRHIRIQYPITIFDQTTLTDDLFTLELFGSGGNGSVPFTGTYDALTNRYTLTLDEQTALAAGKRYTLAIGAGAKLVTGAVDTAGAVFDIYCADFYASGVAYLDGADQPLDVTAAATVDYLKARVTFVNDSGGAEHARLALAVYDAASGELTAVEYAAFDDVSVGESVKEVILSGYGDFDVPSAHKIRLFVWGGTDGMQPLTRAEELFTPIQD
ncbi:MAG: fibronectin type III domain-containing protein, partial [Clostridiales bacterium]|nr:fibronectin type III domain-containing protein [Clostridiales bacterium]